MSPMTDVLAEQNGHFVHRSPVKHFDLNAIELIWTDIKGRLTNKNNFNWKDLESLVREVFSQVDQTK
jgi:hypothetical protein